MSKYILYEDPQAFNDHSLIMSAFQNMGDVDQAKLALDTVQQKYLDRPWVEQRRVLIGMFPKFQSVFSAFDKANRPQPQSVEDLIKIFPAGSLVTPKAEKQQNGGTINYFKFFK